MRQARMLGLGLFALALLGLSTGCRRKAQQLAPVSGKVSFHGAPLRGGHIVFSPDVARGESDSAPIAYGKINADGSYDLFTEMSRGAAPGTYRVAVVSYSGIEIPGDRVNSLPQLKFPQATLPDRYCDPVLSMLKCEIKPNKLNPIDFELVD